MASLLGRRKTIKELEERIADLSAFIGPAYANTLGSIGVTNGTSYGGSADPEIAVESIIAVYACVSLLADVIGSLPLHLYRRSAAGRTRIEVNSRDYTRGRGYPGSLARVIGEIPNPEMTAQDLWTLVMGHSALWGNAYIEVLRGEDGRPAELWPLRPDRMKVDRDEYGDLRYSYTPYGQGSPLVIPEVMHIRAFGTDGVMGLSPIGVARTTLSADKGAQTYADQWFANGATPSAIVTIPKGPQDKFKDRVANYRRALQSRYGGARNAGRIAVIEEGVSWQALSVSQRDMQYIEQRKFTVAEIARLFRIPPHMIQDVERDSSWGTGIEQQNLAWLAYTLRPPLSRIEGAIGRQLGLLPGAKTLADESLYAEFLTADLLRADIKTRYEAYGVGVQWGFLSRADVRTFENLDQEQGLEAPLTPVTHVAGPPPTVADQKPDMPPPPPSDPTIAQNAALIAALTARALEPQQMQLSETDSDETGEKGYAAMRNVDTRPIVDLIGEVGARRILASEDFAQREDESRARLESLVETVGTLTEQMRASERAAARRALVTSQGFEKLLEEVRTPRRKKVERDEDGFITEVIEVPMEVNDA